MREKQIESYLKKEVEKIKGLCWKFVSPGNAGVPDRIVLLPSGHTIFVELKNGKEGRLSPMQQYTQKKLKGMNIETYVITSKEEVDEFIKRVRETHCQNLFRTTIKK